MRISAACDPTDVSLIARPSFPVSQRGGRSSGEKPLAPSLIFFLALAATLSGLGNIGTANATIIESRVAASPDDAEEFADSTMYLSSSDLELIHDSSDQVVGIRWAGLGIPKGATITAAYIQFSAKESQSEVTNLTLAGQAADDAPTFTSANGNISTRPRTAATVSWAPVPWTAGETGANQRTPDLSAVVQQIVNRSGWASGNALAIIITGTGHRTAWAYNGNAALAPLLHVEFGGSTPTDNPPVAQLSVSKPAPLTVLADASGSTDTDATPIASYKFDFGDGSLIVTTTPPTATAQHVYAAANTYTVKVTVTDTGGKTGTASANVTVTAPVVTTVEARTAASSDDAEESSTGSVNLTSSDLELIHDSTDQTVGMRWTNLAILNSATITTAYIQFAAKESQSETTNLTIAGQAADNAATFTSATNDVSSRSRTSATTAWAPVPWVADSVGPSQRTPDLKAVIQQIVNRSGWASGNALAIIITGTGHRTAWAYNGNASLLHVEFTGGITPTDNPPVAQLSVSKPSSPPLTVLADASGSTDTDATPIASYKFDFGDGTSTVTTIAPTATAQHTYATAGTYTVKVTVTDTGGKTGTASASVTVSSSSSGSQIAVYAGYYDTHHDSHLQTKPNPWQGSSNVVFVGTPDNSSGGWDSSGLRIDNLTGGSLSISVTVDIGSHHYALWGTRTVPAGSKLILAQTGFENFDGSDTNPAGCVGCNPKECSTLVTSTVPVAHVTIGGKTTNYYDTGQYMNTHGVDQAGCPYTGTRNDESHNWVQISTSAALTEPPPQASLGEAPQVADDAAGAARLSMGGPFPNPTRGAFAVAFTTPRTGMVRLGIYDVTGRLVRKCVDGELEAGGYRFNTDLTGVSPGIYFCTLWTREGTLNTPFVVMR